MKSNMLRVLLAVVLASLVSVSFGRLVIYGP